jgi:hypothetical protein
MVETQKEQRSAKYAKIGQQSLSNFESAIPSILEAVQNIKGEICACI